MPACLITANDPLITWLSPDIAMIYLTAICKSALMLFNKKCFSWFVL